MLLSAHHLGGSLKEGEEKIKASNEIFVDVNALVSRCHWRASEEGLEVKKLLGYFETLKETVDKMK